MNPVIIAFLVGGFLGTIVGFFFSLIAIGIGKGLKEVQEGTKRNEN